MASGALAQWPCCPSKVKVVIQALSPFLMMENTNFACEYHKFNQCKAEFILERKHFYIALSHAHFTFSHAHFSLWGQKMKMRMQKSDKKTLALLVWIQLKAREIPQLEMSNSTLENYIHSKILMACLKGLNYHSAKYSYWGYQLTMHWSTASTSKTSALKLPHLAVVATK